MRGPINPGTPGTPVPVDGGLVGLALAGSLVTYAPPAPTVGTGINLIQGLSDEYPQATIPNIYKGFNGLNTDILTRTGGFRPNNLGFVPPNSEAQALTPGKGFLWYFYDLALGTAPQGTTRSRLLPVLLPALGTEQTANMPVTFSAAERTSADGATVTPNGFYFLGNPFQQAFDLTGLTETTAAALQSAVTFWNPNAGGAQVAEGNGTPGSYVVRNAIAADTPAANQISDDVQVWQGFYVQTTGATAAALPAFLFASTSRVSTARPTFYGRPGEASAEATAMLAFRLAGVTDIGETYDEAAQLYFNADGALAWDPFDLSKLGSMGYPTATLAPVGIGPEGEADHALAQRSLPIGLAGPTATPLRLDVAGAAGRFTLAWAATDVPAGWSMSLRDTQTGATVDLRTAETYTFTAGEGTTDRFVVTVAPRTVAAEGPAEAEALALTAPRPNPAVSRTSVGVTASAGEAVSVAVFDALGRRVAVLFDGQADGSERTLRVDTSALAPGVYTVRAVAGGRVAAQRLAVVR